ncbi:MAG: selenocysteine-specific translation elongation factor, partial [Planctomycetales bacterium]|nr:selenocysteine-specific translation elongation factor [Planctomycetales bacterium]
MDGNYSIVGVVGHIDHGKTSLVAALTGVDTDTHPEEKRRGITIDLGFAHCRIGERQFAFIDAPGHQRFIGNLLAGVSSVDIGLLVVACDQGIQEQTLEHVAILRQLGVPRLIVVISRTDLASEEDARELAEELRLFLSEYGFTEFPVVRVAAPSGLGLDDLRAELTAAARVGERVASQHFRLPIDRVFSVPGRGCVVAGTVWSGSVRVGDVVEIARTRQRVRVRELELHGVAVEDSRVGYRTAINLSGISARELGRGDELVAVGTHRSTTRLLIELSLFAEAPDVSCPAVVQLHTATTHCSARLVGAKRLGTPCYLVAETDQPLVATYGQRCLFRRPYPVGS